MVYENDCIMLYSGAVEDWIKNDKTILNLYHLLPPWPSVKSVEVQEVEHGRTSNLIKSGVGPFLHDIFQKIISRSTCQSLGHQSLSRARRASEQDAARNLCTDLTRAQTELIPVVRSSGQREKMIWLSWGAAFLWRFGEYDFTDPACQQDKQEERKQLQLNIIQIHKCFQRMMHDWMFKELLIQ